ncbi:MAG TPA: thioredoxin family protein [Spirochaetota bacterium]|nr:thioredoxin family protein [Spirochaetota bacterium]
MNKYFKIILPAVIAVVFMIGAPYIKTPCDCGANLTLAFTGAILGCSVEKESAQQAEVNEKPIAVASEKENKTELKVTFVELGSVNCVPCRMMQPVMEQVEKKYPGQVKVIFHDVWTESGRSEGSRYGIRVIPTQVFLDKAGKEYFRHEGFFPLEEIEKILKRKGVN